jgi:CHASE2 domain-containing sensor protein
MKRLLRQWLHQDHVIVALMAMSVIGIIMLITFNVAFLNPVEQMIGNLKFTDLYTKVKNFHSVPDTSRFVTIVDMSDLYNRGDIADLLATIARQEPRAIGVDLLMEGERDDVEGNIKLLNTVDSLRSMLVMATKLTEYDASSATFAATSRSYVSEMLDSLNEGFVNLEDDMQHAIIRECRSGMRMADRPGLLPSLPAATLMRFGIDVPLRNQPVLVDFALQHFPVVRYDSVAQHPELIKGRMVLVGACHEESDTHLTPLGKIAGVELHAYAVHTLMNHRQVTDAPLWLNLLAAFIACYLLAVFIEMSERRSDRSKPSALRIFLDESEWLKGAIVLVMAILATLVMHWVFEQFGLYINALLVLASMAFVVQAHDTYMALINALAVRHPHNWWIRHSLAQADD